MLELAVIVKWCIEKRIICRNDTLTNFLEARFAHKCLSSFVTRPKKIHKGVLGVGIIRSCVVINGRDNGLFTIWGLKFTEHISMNEIEML